MGTGELRRIHSRVVWDVAPGGQVHDRVCAPLGGPEHLFHFLLNGGGHCRVADVGVDLDQEIAANDHRLGLGVVDVGGDDGAAAGHLVPDVFGVNALADADELHLGGYDTLAGVAHLGRGHSGLAPQRLSSQSWERLRHVLAAQGNAVAFIFLDVAAGHDPLPPQRGETLPEVEAGAGVGVGAAGVIDVERRIVLLPEASGGRREGHLPERHPDGRLRSFTVNFRLAGKLDLPWNWLVYSVWTIALLQI